MVVPDQIDDYISYITWSFEQKWLMPMSHTLVCKMKEFMEMMSSLKVEAG